MDLISLLENFFSETDNESNKEPAKEIKAKTQGVDKFNLSENNEGIAGIIRAAKNYAQTNYKLVTAIRDLTFLIAENIQTSDLPPREELGLHIEKEYTYYISVIINFKFGNEWKEVRFFTDTTRYSPMDDIHALCKALVGPEGKRLLNWLENQQKQAASDLQIVESIQARFQK